MTDKVFEIILKLEHIKDDLKHVDNDFIAKAFPRNRNINTYKIQKEIDQLMKWVKEEDENDL